MPVQATRAEKIKFATEEAKQGKSYKEIVRIIVKKFGDKESSAGYYAWYGIRNVAGRPVPLTKTSPQPLSSPEGGTLTSTLASEHTKLKQLALELGVIFGYDVRDEVKLSDIARSVPSSLSRRTVDVLWKASGINIPIEVQVHGSLDSVMERFDLIWADCKKMMVISNEIDLKELEERVMYSKPKQFRDKMIYVNQKDLMNIANNITSLGEFRRRISLI